MIDGLIVTADTVDSTFVSKIQQYDIPFVQIGRPPSDQRRFTISYVDVDNEAGAYLAASHLVQLGYRRIGQLATAHNTAGADRDAGFRHALGRPWTGGR